MADIFNRYRWCLRRRLFGGGFGLSMNRYNCENCGFEGEGWEQPVISFKFDGKNIFYCLECLTRLVKINEEDKIK